MEISRINVINSGNSGADRAFEIAVKKPASADTAKVDTATLDKAMTTTDNKITEDFLQKVIERVNKQLRGTNREFNYSIHEKTGQYMIKVLDQDTKEVIREIPPEKVLDAVAKMWDLTGIFVDERT